MDNPFNSDSIVLDTSGGSADLMFKKPIKALQFLVRMYPFKPNTNYPPYEKVFTLKDFNNTLLENFTVEDGKTKLVSTEFVKGVSHIKISVNPSYTYESNAIIAIDDLCFTVAE